MATSCRAVIEFLTGTIHATRHVQTDCYVPVRSPLQLTERGSFFRRKVTVNIKLTVLSGLMKILNRGTFGDYRYVCIYIHLYIHTYVHACIHTYIQTYVRMQIHMFNVYDTCCVTHCYFTVCDHLIVSYFGKMNLKNCKNRTLDLLIMLVNSIFN
jgi:hypothetical protein